MNPFHLTREDVYNDFSYYGSERYRAYMTGKAWQQYERSFNLHGEKLAYQEYVRCHMQSRWEELYGRDLTEEEISGDSPA